MLKPCPFCGSLAEISYARFQVQSACSQKNIPENATFIGAKTIGHINPHTIYLYQKTAYIPQCTNSACIGRNRKKFHTMQEAEEAWNRRAGE